MTPSGFPYPDPPDPEAIVQCIRCGMCLPHCPTYAVLGIEQDSPRGRIALIKAVSDGRLDVSDSDFQKHISQCLGCRACETACPAGVQFGYLLETTRGQIEQARAGKVEPRSADFSQPPAETRRADPSRPPADGGGEEEAARRSPQEAALRTLVFDGLFSSPRRLDVAGGLLRFYQRSGAQRLARGSGILRLLGLAKTERLLPPLSPRPYHADGVERRSGYAPEADRPRARVALFAGCVQRLMFADVNRATERVLLRNGCAVVAPTGQTCCGALHAHAGEREAAKDLARHNLDAFDLDAVDVIIINAAGCGAMLKEYGELLHDDPQYAERAHAFSAKVKDIHEFLAELPLDPPRSAPQPLRVTYQDACHLWHGQKIRLAPRVVLQTIPGLELVEMNQSDWCCGSAGTYNVVHPDLSAQVLDLKMDNVTRTEADILAAPNPGCILQLQSGVQQRGLAMRVVHPIELLDAAYARERKTRDV